MFVILFLVFFYTNLFSTSYEDQENFDASLSLNEKKANYLLESLVEKKLFKFTYPKTGSGLSEATIREILKIKNLSDKFITPTHFHDEESVEYNIDVGNKLIMIFRDPRDVALSYINFKIDIEKDLLKQSIDGWEKKTNQSYQDLIKNYFESQHFGSMFNAYKAMLKYRNNENVCLLQYEKLLGSKGGGSDEERNSQIEKLIKFLDIKLSENELKSVNDNYYGNSWTFYKGQINSYKDTFNKEQINIIEEKLGNLIEPLSEYYDFSR